MMSIFHRRDWFCHFFHSLCLCRSKWFWRNVTHGFHFLWVWWWNVTMVSQLIVFLKTRNSAVLSQRCTFNSSCCQSNSCCNDRGGDYLHCRKMKMTPWLFQERRRNVRMKTLFVECLVTHGRRVSCDTWSIDQSEMRLFLLPVPGSCVEKEKQARPGRA